MDMLPKFFFIRRMQQNWQFILLILTPLILLPVIIIGRTAEFRCAYVILIMATYWISEVLPLSVTAVIPVVAFPLLGVLGTKIVCAVYMKDTTVLFLGGLMMAVAVEHCNLHKRIALFVMVRVGQSPKRLLAGLMLITTFLSMWISNTATAAMMVPIVDAIVNEIEETKAAQTSRKEAQEPGDEEPLERTRFVKPGERQIRLMEQEEGFLEYEEPAECYEASRRSSDSRKTLPGDQESSHAIKKMLFLGVAFACNIGGTGTPLGCGPSIVVFSILQSTFGEETGLNFASWMMYNIPGMLVCTALGWFWLQIFCRTSGLCKKKTREDDADELNESQQQSIREFLLSQYRALGPISQHEAIVSASFVILVFLWVFRSPGFVSGWAHLFGRSHDSKLYIHNASPAILMVLLLFCIPKSFKNALKTDDKSSRQQTVETCLSWEVVNKKTPWGIVLLLGGGLAMAEGAQVSGLSRWLGDGLQYFKFMPKGAIAFLLSVIMAMMTEVASNTATASFFLPVIKDLALAIGVNPIYLMLPAAVCCAYAFMLPVATPGNAIILKRSGLETREMIRAGFVMNLLCVTTTSFMINTLGRAFFDFETFPDWAKNVTSEAP
ncbi:Na(+)/citrate cotransporter-like isoform X1 [Macrobrachium nipponense]|uniref:Na(+)/citrate cotransporter-like isoform X1 n=1 Tax=Macrobrachium nipponense TaxID=159736 RepID=UPI0030C84E38